MIYGTPFERLKNDLDNISKSPDDIPIDTAEEEKEAPGIDYSTNGPKWRGGAVIELSSKGAYVKRIPNAVRQAIRDALVVRFGSKRKFSLARDKRQRNIYTVYVSPKLMQKEMGGSRQAFCNAIRGALPTDALAKLGFTFEVY